MTLETLFAKFDLFADAPDAVAEMRGLAPTARPEPAQGNALGKRPHNRPKL